MVKLIKLATDLIKSFEFDQKRLKREKTNYIDFFDYI